MASDNHDDEVSKPLPGGSFDACVSRFEDHDDVEDPEALCGWLEDQSDHDAVANWDPDEETLDDLLEALNDPEAEKVLQDLTVTYVSGVENPAQDSQWVMAKDADARGADWGVTAPLLFKASSPLSKQPDDEEGDEDEPDEDEADDEEDQKAWAPVLIPNETDKQGDVIPPHEIEQAAHDFLANYRNVDTDHDLMEGKGVPIESWTLKQEGTFTLPDGEETREYPEGTWFMGVQFNDEAWGRVKAGELQGFSIYGEAEGRPVAEILGLEGGTVERTAGSPLTLASKAAEIQEVAKETNETLTMSDETTEDGEGADGGDADVTLESIKSTVDENNDLAKEAREGLNDLEKSHESLEDRVGDIEDEVETLKSEETTDDGGEEADAGEGEETGKDEEGADGGTPEDAVTEEDLEEAKESLKDETEDTAQEAAEAAVKSVLGLDDDEDLPDDAEERKEVLRKGLVEAGEDGGESLGSPDEWGDEDVNEVFN